MSGNDWPWGPWLPDHAEKQQWQNFIEPIRSQHLAKQFASSQHLQLCVIYGTISESVRSYFCNLRGVQALPVPLANPDIGPLNEGKRVIFVPHPGRWRFIPQDQRTYTAKQFFTILGRSLAGQMPVNPQ
jgi:hypothetical protein